METMPTRKQLLRNAIAHAKEMGFTVFAIRVKMEGFPTDEIIINSHDNFDSKLEYWCKTYNDDLVHNFSPTISIVDYVYANTYEEVQKLLF